VRPQRAERTLLTRAVGLAALTGAAALAPAALLRGVEGLAGAVLGVALVLAFLLLGQLPLAQAARGRRGIGAALLLALYAGRVALLLVTYRLVVAGAGDVDPDAVGLTVIACGLAWTTGTVWSALRWRPLVVEPDRVEDPG
jgi:ATP synthase protein I